MKNWFTIPGIAEDGLQTLENRIHGLGYIKDFYTTYTHKHPVFLDLGSAEGLISDYVFGKDSIVTCIDANTDSIDIAKKIYKDRPNYSFLNLDLNEFKTIDSLQRKYDCVLMLAVLQKLKDPLGFLDHIVSRTQSYMYCIRVPQKFLDSYEIKFKKIMETRYDLNRRVTGEQDNQGILFVYVRKGHTLRTAKLNESYKKVIVKYNDLLASDTVLWSFPKSGRTWLRYLFACYVQHTTSLASFSLEFIPAEDWNKYRHQSDFPHIQFTHNYYDHYQNELGYDSIIHQDVLDTKPVIFLHRHPLDVIVSFYYQKKLREKQYSGNLESFIFDSTYGIVRHIKYMNTALDYLQNRQNVLYVSYEKLRQDTEREVKRIFDFMNYNYNNDALLKSISDSEFSRMQEQEILASKKSKFAKTSRLGINNWSGSSDQLKARKGIVHNYENELGKHYSEKLLSNPDISNLILRLSSLN